MRDIFFRHPVLVTLFAVLLYAGNAAAQTVQPADPELAGQELDEPASEVDPYEDWNRKVYSFNETIDDWFLRPVAQGYRTITPGFVDRGITNFFNNLTEIRNFANSVFQLKLESAVVATGRFTYNTVFGLGGFIDVATMFELPERPEDFGQTLGYWGVNSGPYLMLPFMGPSSPRDFSGFVSDNLLLPSAWQLAESPDIYYARALQVVDTRADLIPAEGFMSGDSYTFIRNAYLQRRAYLINDGQTVDDPFAGDDDDEDLMLEDF